MLLQAQLTVGWHDDTDTTLAAILLHEAAEKAGEDYAKALATTLDSVENARISGLERLFRRRTGGFEKIKRFISTLAALPHPAKLPDPLICRIDAFAYFFLRGAKNLDHLLPLGAAINAGFRETHKAWSRTIAALENFERVGKPLTEDTSISADQYLALRGIVSRLSARDERRALATLMVSGPSSIDEISQDLGLNYSLSQRTVAIFLEIGVVERRSGEVFAIAESSLPLTAFSLRETMGLDLLNIPVLKED